MLQIGLFGYDLTLFNEACSAASDICNLCDYNDYDGWSVGVLMDFPMVFGAPDLGFCIAETSTCTFGY
jgi:hypothetical protein